jgi:PPOX class probable F420-dependent enzyme
VTLFAVQEASYRRAAGALTGSWPEAQAMDREALDAFLEARRYCVLATALQDGRPQARPVAFTVRGDEIWFATVAGGRLRNLRRTPWVSVVVTEGDGDEHRAVAADGPVELSEPPEELLQRWEERFGSRAEWAVAWFRLRPERLFSYDARR